MISNADKIGFFSPVSKMRDLQKACAKGACDTQLKKGCAEYGKQAGVVIGKIAERLRPVQEGFIY